jgi:hypothetical protein
MPSRCGQVRDDAVKVVGAGRLIRAATGDLWITQRLRRDVLGTPACPASVGIRASSEKGAPNLRGRASR